MAMGFCLVWYWYRVNLLFSDPGLHRVSSFRKPSKDSKRRLGVWTAKNIILEIAP